MYLRKTLLAGTRKLQLHHVGKSESSGWRVKYLLDKELSHQPPLPSLPITL